MIVKTHSYRFAEEILQHKDFKPIYDELMDVCEGCPLPRYEGKSHTQKGLDIVQQVLNSYFYISFVRRNWEPEPLATPEENEDALRSDFRKSFQLDNGKIITVQIEVEFGNVASSYRNYFKFQLSFAYNLTDMCVLIVPSNDLCKRIDSGVSNFEKVVREIEQAKLTITVPTLIIGLFDRDDYGVMLDEWDIKKQDIPIDIAKGSTIATHPKHIAFITDFIDNNIEKK